MAYHNWSEVYQYYLSTEGASYQDCSDKFGIPIGTIKEKGALEAWNDKKQQLTKMALALIEERTANEIAKRNKEHIQLAKVLQAGAIKALAEGNKPTSARDVKEWIETGVKLERQALGMDENVNPKIGFSDNQGRKLEIFWGNGDSLSEY